MCKVREDTKRPTKANTSKGNLTGLLDLPQEQRGNTVAVNYEEGSDSMLTIPYRSRAESKLLLAMRSASFWGGGHGCRMRRIELVRNVAKWP